MEIESSDLILSLREQLSSAHYQIALLSAQLAKVQRDSGDNV